MQFQPPSQPGRPQQEPGQYPQPQTGYPQWQGQPQQPYYSPQQPDQFPQQQPYYPPQQQQWQQPPMMPMQQPQQPKKKKTGRILGIGCGSLVALVVLIVIIAAAGNKGTGSPSADTTTPAAQTTTQATTQPTSASTQAANKIGSSVTSASWIVTVNSAKTDAGDGVLNVPKAGNVYLVVNITMKNTDTSAQVASTILQWKLLDQQGQSYEEDIAFGGSSPDGSVVAGQQLRGNVAFEVPKSIHQYTLQFQPGFDGSQIVQWTVSI